MSLFLVECPIESCYVCGGFQLSFLAKKALGGRSWGAILLREDKINQNNDAF